MLNLCGIVEAARNFPMSGINSGHYYLPTYQIWMTSDNVEFLCRVLEAIMKMADILKILKTQNCSPFSKWPPQYRTNSTLSDFNDIPYVGRL
jgi:hypothetical protein